MCDSAQLLSRLPAQATADLFEWDPVDTMTQYLKVALSQAVTGRDALDPRFEIRITDDLPYNEYYVLQKLGVF